jgi:lysozyme
MDKLLEKFKSVEGKYTKELITAFLSQLKRHEGFSSVIYIDITNHLSIGYGRNLSSVGISKEEAELITSISKNKYDIPALKPIKIGDAYYLGYGCDVTNEGISEEIAEILLINDVIKAIPIATSYLNNIPNISEIRRLAFINMAFNLGKKLYTMTKTAKYVRENDWDMVSKEMLDSLWAKQVKGRAIELSHQILNDEII